MCHKTSILYKPWETAHKLQAFRTQGSFLSLLVLLYGSMDNNMYF
jgi:hypothetical protein